MHPSVQLSPRRSEEDILECVLVHRSHIPELIWQKVRGSVKENERVQNRIPRVLRDLAEKLGPPFLSPRGVWVPQGPHGQLLGGALTSAPFLHPPSPPSLCDRTIHAMSHGHCTVKFIIFCDPPFSLWFICSSKLSVDWVTTDICCYIMQQPLSSSSIQAVTFHWVCWTSFDLRWAQESE